MIGVLLVDDEALTLEVHRSYVERIPGFRVVAESTGARAAVAALLDPTPSRPIDLVLLDMTMPDGSGLDVLRHVRAHGTDVDVIAITAVRDAATVRQVLSLGVQQYLVKPFTFAAFRARLEQYRDHREIVRGTRGPATQAEIDAMLAAQAPLSPSLPKGLSAQTMARVCSALRSGGSHSASEIADQLGLSRVAARRYLEHLVDAGTVERSARYGTGGRPRSEYRWAD